MVFIPFIGGAVTLKDQPRSAYDDAQIGLAGPIAGTFASLVFLQIYKWTDQPLYLAIAVAGFAVNLINLLPIGMLDGGRISAAVTKWMWVFGGGVLVYKVVTPAESADRAHRRPRRLPGLSVDRPREG